jgi:hypothetical protein
MPRVYNGMPATSLAGVRWEAGRGAPIELAALPGGAVAMRHSRYPRGPALIYTRAEIEAFIGGAKDGDFDDLIA